MLTFWDDAWDISLWNKWGDNNMQATNGIANDVFTNGHRWPIISENDSVQRAYCEMRESGEGHPLAEMLALQRPPDIRSDSTFLAGMKTDCDPAERRYRREAEAGGVNTSGAVYMSKLAAEGCPGDPKAFIRTRGDVIRRCEDLNYDLHLDGRHVVKSQDVAPAPTPDFDPESIADRLEHTLDANPGMEAELAAKPEMFKEAWHNARESLKPDYS